MTDIDRWANKETSKSPEAIILAKSKALFKQLHTHAWHLAFRYKMTIKEREGRGAKIAFLFQFYLSLRLKSPLAKPSRAVEQVNKRRAKEEQSIKQSIRNLAYLNSFEM